MRQLLIAVIVATLAACSLAASASAESDYLTIPESREYLTQSIEHRFGEAAGESIRNFLRSMECHKLNTTTNRCTFWFGVGDLVFRGSARVRLTYCRVESSTEYCWNTAGRAKILNEYCYRVEHRSRSACTRVVRWRY
jgi:hypothetical protein